MDMEFSEVQIFEKKAFLQEALFSLIHSPRNIERIRELSPYDNIRAEAFDYIEKQVEPLSELQSESERRQMNEALTTLKINIEQYGRASSTYNLIRTSLTRNFVAYMATSRERVLFFFFGASRSTKKRLSATGGGEREVGPPSRSCFLPLSGRGSDVAYKLNFSFLLLFMQRRPKRMLVGRR